MRGKKDIEDMKGIKEKKWDTRGMRKKKRNWGSCDIVSHSHHTPFLNPYINMQSLK